MRERTKIAYMPYRAIFVISLALMVLAGCGKKGEPFQISRLGFSMRMPEGWKREGDCFYADPEYYYPSASVMDFSMQGASLTECVDNLLSETEKMEKVQAGLMRALGKIAGVEDSEEIKEAEEAIQSKVLSKTPRTISKHEAIEVVTEAPVSTLEVFILRGDTVIWVTFLAAKEDFPKYEQLFRDAIETIKVR